MSADSFHKLEFAVAFAAGATFFIFFWFFFLESVVRARRTREFYQRQERYAIKDGMVIHIEPPRETRHPGGVTTEIDVGARPIPRNWVFPAYWEDP